MTAAAWPLPPVGFDPGHGGPEPGAVVDGPTNERVEEKRINLRVGYLVRRLLPNVQLTRQIDEYVSLHERARRLRVARVEAVVSGHCDAHPTSRVLHGTHAYYRKGDRMGRELARFAVANAPEPLRLQKGGVFCAHGDDWLRRAQNVVSVYEPTPTVLIEFGYMTNRLDLLYLLSVDGVEACARLAADVLEYYRHMTYGVAL